MERVNPPPTRVWSEGGGMGVVVGEERENPPPTRVWSEGGGHRSGGGWVEPIYDVKKHLVSVIIQ